MQLSQRVYWLCGPAYGSHQNVYGIRTDEGVVLIDAGRDRRDDSIVRANLKAWGLSEMPVTHLLLTHEHYEHSANAWRWLARGAALAASPCAAQGIGRGGERVADYAFPELPSFRTCAVGMTLCDGTRLSAGGVNIVAIHTPGHSPGSVVYLLENEGQTLFTGDTVLITAMCRHAAPGWTGDAGFDGELYLSSLEKLSSLEIDRLLPGHGELCLADAAPLLWDACVQTRRLLTAPMQARRFAR